MITEVILPVMGETMNEGQIVEWFKKEGDAVKKGEALFSIESDKATLEVEAGADGVLRKIFVPAKETAPVLAVVGLITKTADEDISSYSGAAKAAPAPAAAAEPAKTVAPQAAVVQAGTAAPPLYVVPDKQAADISARDRVFASPRARKLAREHGIAIESVTGSGHQGRIIENDVKAFLVSAPRAANAPVATSLRQDFTGQTKPMDGVRAVIARRMFEGHATTAPVTLTMEADATEFAAMRERIKSSFGEGLTIGYNDLFIKLCARALREFPTMNARLDEQAGMIHFLQEVHVALAVDTERGLLVPVVRNPDQKSIGQAARELRVVIDKARSGKASKEELSGSTFTITNLGMFEVDSFTPILNLPETAILGLGRIKERPAVKDGALCVRKMMWLSLTFDHRLNDGAPAAAFLQYIKNRVEDPFLWLAEVI